MGAIKRSAARLATKVAASRAKAVATPATAMRMPAKMGPATDTVCPPSELTAMAAGRRSRGTRRGTADERAGWSTAPTPAATNATTYRAQTDGCGWAAITASARLQPASSIWVTMRRRRRSTASAMAPPARAKTTIGASWTRASRPMDSELWVSCHSSNGRATTVTWRPRPLMSWPSQIIRKSRSRFSGSRSTRRPRRPCRCLSGAWDMPEGYAGRPFRRSSLRLLRWSGLPQQDHGHANEPDQEAQEGRPLEHWNRPDVGSVKDPGVGIDRMVGRVDRDEGQEDGHDHGPRGDEPARENGAWLGEEPQAEDDGDEPAGHEEDVRDHAMGQVVVHREDADERARSPR